MPPPESVTFSDPASTYPDGLLPARPWRGSSTVHDAVHNRAPSRRYLQPGFGVLAVAAAGVLCAFCCVVDTLSAQCLRRRPCANPLVAAVFRTKWLLRERCSATCPRRRPPGQVRHTQGGLQITAVRSGDLAYGSGTKSTPEGSFWMASPRSGAQPTRSFQELGHSICACARAHAQIVPHWRDRQLRRWPEVVSALHMGDGPWPVDTDRLSHLAQVVVQLMIPP